MRSPFKPLPESTGAPSGCPVSDSLPVPATHGAPTAAAPAAASWPMLSRRSMVTGMAAGLIPAAPVAAASGGDDPDARLLELGERYQQLCALEVGADEAYERCCESV